MKIEIFQSSHGDCLLLESKKGKRILCDGGMKDSMIKYVAPALDSLRENDPAAKIDLVYVSHIDADHIGGVLQLLEDAAQWRVYERHVAGGDPDFEKPSRPRPPPMTDIWHNAFGDQVDNVGAIEDLLAAAAPMMAATQSEVGIQASFEMQQIALGVDHAIKVSKLAAKNVLNMKLNDLGAGPAKLLMVRPGQQAIGIGDFQVTIIGPTEKELADLREGWNNWLNANEKKVKEINRKIREIVEDFSASATPQSIALYDWNGVPGFRNVTVPNLASLVLLVREGTSTLLLTGDAQHDVLMDQLRGAGLLANGYLHVDVLKVQHHGSENNMSPEFAKTVSADHYIFCGNGANGNPETKVIQQIFDSRTSTDPNERALAPEAQDNKRPFHFWFSTSSKTPPESVKDLAKFKKAEESIRKLKASSGNRLKTHYNSKTSIVLEL